MTPWFDAMFGLFVGRLKPQNRGHTQVPGICIGSSPVKKPHARTSSWGASLKNKSFRFAPSRCAHLYRQHQCVLRPGLTKDGKEMKRTYDIIRLYRAHVSEIWQLYRCIHWFVYSRWRYGTWNVGDPAVWSYHAPLEQNVSLSTLRFDTLEKTRGPTSIQNKYDHFPGNRYA